MEWFCHFLITAVPALVLGAAHCMQMLSAWGQFVTEAEVVVMMAAWCCSAVGSWGSARQKPQL